MLKRKIELLKFRIKNGYSKSDLWCLDYKIAKFVLPRLKEFRKSNRFGYPMSFKNKEEWDICLDKMIFAFEFFINDEDYDFKIRIKKSKKAEVGFKLFGKYFMDLWD